MNRTGSNLLFLAVGLTLGAAVGYVVASDKKEEWLKDITRLVDKVKSNVSGSVSKGKHYAEEGIKKGKEQLEELIEDAR